MMGMRPVPEIQFCDLLPCAWIKFVTRRLNFAICQGTGFFSARDWSAGKWGGFAAPALPNVGCMVYEMCLASRLLSSSL
jgi:hypothetical protein